MADAWEWPRAVCVQYDVRNAGHSAYDGDTFRADVDLGADLERRRLPIRLAGLNAPEIRDQDPLIRERAYLARDYLRSLLPVGTAIKLVSVAYDKYQPRVDAYVFRKEDDLDINRAMLDSGHAVISVGLEEA